MKTPLGAHAYHMIQCSHIPNSFTKTRRSQFAFLIEISKTILYATQMPNVTVMNRAKCMCAATFNPQQLET